MRRRRFITPVGSAAAGCAWRLAYPEQSLTRTPWGIETVSCRLQLWACWAQWWQVRRRKKKADIPIGPANGAGYLMATCRAMTRPSPFASRRPRSTRSIRPGSSRLDGLVG